VARKDPYRGFRFRVEFDNLQHGGFSRVKGLTRETKFESRREGGVNDYEHKLATATSYGNLTLERGLVDPYLYSWHDDVVEGTILRRTLTVALHDETDQEVWRWLIERAFPVKWGATDMDAGAAQIVVESVEFAHEGIRKG
jgi:phage tail-like protein